MKRAPLRVGLDFRFLALERHNLVRGIPRFTQEQLQAVLALDAESTYLILCDADNDVDAIRPEIRLAPNIHIERSPDNAWPAWDANGDDRSLLARYSAYQRWLEGLDLDLYHSTCPFWVSRLILPGFDVCPYVATAYDLLPLLYPSHIPAELAEAYSYGLLFVEQATRIGAISQATARDLVDHLGVSADRIDLTSPAVSPSFRPLPPDVTRSILASLDHPARRRFPRRRVRIPPSYVLCVTDLHYTKNLFLLLEAHAALPSRTRTQFPLIVAGHLGKGDIEVLWRRAQRLGVELDRELIITGRVSDYELMGLYNGATVMVCPSHQEGFGLTVAEAMRCGAAVITTTRSALPEVAGDAAVLVDSEEAPAFTEAIDTLVHDTDFRSELSGRGRARASRYTPAALARATLALYQNAVSAAQAPTISAVRVALWSPIAPQPSPHADYADDLITALVAESDLDVDVFVGDGVAPTPELMHVATMRHWSDFDRHVRQAPYDVSIYQFAASPLHRFMEHAMLAHPGIIVLHDIDALAEPARGGREAEDVAAEKDPMLRHGIADVARCCVALTPEAGRDLQRRYPNMDVEVIPYGVRDPRTHWLGLDRDMARAYLDIDPRAFVVVAPGPIEAAAHLDAVVDAVGAFQHPFQTALLAILGWTADTACESELRSRAEKLGIGEAVRMMGQVSARTFDVYLAASDVVVVLRPESQAHMPAAVLRALAAGRCAVMAEIPALSSIPDSACLCLPAGSDAATGLAAALTAIAADPDRRSTLEREARELYEATARLEPMIARYVTLLRKEGGSGSPRRPAAKANATSIARAGRPAPRAGALPYCKVCELEDFAHPQLESVIQTVMPHKRAMFGSNFPRRYEHRDDWEAAMALRTLSDHGALRSDARVLAVDVRVSEAVFLLTRYVGEVIAVHHWSGQPADHDTTSAPELRDACAAPFAVRAERMTVQPSATTLLPFPDASFDAVLSSASAGHDVSLQDIATAASEIGRVLKPGGIVSLATDLVISTDAASEPIAPITTPLSTKDLEQYVIDASGLKLVDDLELSVSHWTRSTTRNVAAATAAMQLCLADRAEGGRPPEWSCWEMPHVVLERGGLSYTSAHLAMRHRRNGP